MSPGYATIIGIDYWNGINVIGHVMIIGKHQKDQDLFLMDSKIYIKGIRSILAHFQSMNALPIFITFMWEIRSNKTPSPFIHSQRQRTMKTIQMVRAQYTASSLFQIPGFNGNKIRRLQNCHDIPTFLFIMNVIDSRMRRFLQSLPITSITIVQHLFLYLFGLTYESKTIAPRKIKIQDGFVSIAFDNEMFGRFWYVGCHNGSIHIIDPNNNDNSPDMVYILTSSQVQEGQIR
jgi:hypothetical protein